MKQCSQEATQVAIPSRHRINVYYHISALNEGARAKSPEEATTSALCHNL